ncbi:sigma-70 family RNA polymerase sigma factor [Cellvibrio japonicus]|nr:sigma-70 family RNA polymerase sigma factor [Cellvibrio japonicus]QEI12717.1 sigma-70 family RNA polymerase sigma factor [Cellvibrio japonicus]QEI16291.1 sigma-70 family RNA polymerase sigma factor [Cellvibrio japonicus]QEI19869.1 sigma-70 family RNA polymerase sigma factor [Cellvibrio japonicus]
MPSQSSHSFTESLYSDHHHWLKRWLRRRLDCPVQVEDLAHDTFVRILKSHQLAAAPIREPRSYLSTIAGALLIDFFRRRTVERAYLEALAGLAQDEWPSPEEQAEILDVLIRIDALLDGLKPRVRKVFLMSQLDGMTYADIAARLDVSLRTVKSDMATAFGHCFDMVAG